MNLEKYINKEKDIDTELIWKFAHLGSSDSRELKLKELSELAEPENWTSTNSSWENDILYSYLTHTFERAYLLEQENYDESKGYILISQDENYACFNTGLLTDNGEDIICIFNEFTNSPDYKWHLNNFKKKSDWEFLNNFSQTPKVVTYFSEPSKIYFDPSRELIKNLDHILEDNLERFDKSLQEKGKHYINALLTNALDLTIKRCERNYRIAVPQYYKNKITYLLPVNLDGNMMSVAVEDVNGRYRVNTVFTLEMAYKNARLLMKPEADWLIMATKKESK